MRSLAELAKESPDVLRGELPHRDAKGRSKGSAHEGNDMTHITTSRYGTGRAGRATMLTITLLIGLVIGSTATFLMVDRRDSTDTGRAAANVAATSASTQYADWYLRAPTAGRSTTTASRQYADWYTRSTSLAGSTTAGEQYRDWYAGHRGSR
jgi:hypothetical protein